MLALLLIIAAIIGSLALGIVTSGYLTPSFPPELAIPEEPSCLSEEALDSLLAGPVVFTCGYLDDPASEYEWILAAENAQIDRIFIHDEKQLVKRADCDGTAYYSWLCHPPDYGSLWKNTLWKLNDPDPNREIKDGDTFSVYVRKDADHEGYWICEDDTRRPPGLFPSPDFSGSPTPVTSEDEIGRDDIIVDSTTVNGIIVTLFRSGSAFLADIEPLEPEGERRFLIETEYKGVTYDVYENLLVAFAPDSDKYYYFVPKGSFDSSGTMVGEKVDYHVFAITSTKDVAAGFRKSLKLGTFNPIIQKASANPWWAAYLPESKPVIYLYPEQDMLVDISVLPKDGEVTVSDPFYNKYTGWNRIVARPDGSLIYDSQPYRFLYYETEVAGYTIPEEGFVIPTDELEPFLTGAVKTYGLNETETHEFIDYWVPRFKNDVSTPYMFVTFIQQEEIDRVVPLSIVPKPDTAIRIRPYFRPESEHRMVVPQSLPDTPPVRHGFTLVEWGGILDLQ
ncbi:MAG: hypothetical protein NUV98_03435 [Candidatus Roizmanbacteria bacterium]|nr:hypothetical protein [Candidatus Roizmanbacteria bacterium]